MVLAPIPQLIFGSIGFTIFWILAVFPGVPFLPIGRTAGSLVGAMLMVVSRVMTPDEAYSSIDLPILGLLFGMMVVSIYLERADMFNYLGRLLSWRNQGSKDTLLRISLISAVSSALFTNDTACVVLTEFVLKVARQRNSPPHPFLLALASSANIGSAATPIGNPQNLVIAVQSGISFGEFLIGMLPAVLVGVCVNAGVLMCMYWKVLSVQKDLEDTGAGDDVVVDEDDVYSHRFSPAVMSHLSSPLASPERVGNDVVRLRGVMMNMNYSGEVDDSLRSRVIATTSDVNQNEADGDIQMVFSSRSEQSSVTAESLSKDEAASAAAAVGSRSSCNMIRVQVWKTSVAEMCGGGRGIWKRIRLWKTSVYLITIGMLIALLMGLNMSWTAITAALALIVLDFKDARPSLEKVSYSLLIFFCGMFITVDGFNRTGIPTKVWDLLEPYAKIDRVAGLAVLAVVILVLSNVASNVPTVLLLGARVASSAAVISVAGERKAWLVLAWVSTVAGNLSLVGSAANLIVCEQANRAPPHFGYNLGFWTHLKFGVPSTLIVIAIGLTLIR